MQFRLYNDIPYSVNHIPSRVRMLHLLTSRKIIHKNYFENSTTKKVRTTIYRIFIIIKINPRIYIPTQIIQ